MTQTTTDASPNSLGRAALTITVWNLVSRILGFARVLATASALGIAVLGDTYHRTNQVSNLLFELLAGGMLFSVLVPTFVDHLHRSRREDVALLASAMATRATVAMGAVVGAGLIFAEPLMEALSAGVSGPTREAQVELGVFLLWFVLPQLLFYAVGAVASALLQADHRFVATSIAPACNSVVLTATMVAFAVVHDPSAGLVLSGGEKLLLGGGTLAGTVVMTLLPVVATWRGGYPLRVRWHMDSSDLHPLVRRGLWAAGHVGLNQVLVISTVILAGGVNGGVIAYQTAFTFFLLPHALLAHPIFTALYPRLSKSGAAGAHDDFAADLARGTRSINLLVLPAAGLLAAVAEPALSLVSFGELDSRGVALVANTLAAYLLGVAGYSTYFLLTRASYALDDARTPTMINLWVTGATVVAMVVLQAQVDGAGLLVGFGLSTALTTTAGSVVLHRHLRARLATSIRVGSSLRTVAIAASLSTATAWALARCVGWSTTPRAVLAVGLAGVVGVVAYGAGLAVLRSPDLPDLVKRVDRLVGRRL